MPSRRSPWWDRFSWRGNRETSLSTVLGTIAVACSMVNIVGGYLITYRMLRMFRKSGKEKP